AGITGTQDAVITQTAPFTAAAGGVIPFRSSTERDAFSAAEGQLGWLMDSDILQVYTGAQWMAATPTPRRATLSLIRGVAPAGYLGPVVALADGVVTVTARVNNGNGLTLSSSFQQVAVLPEWAWPDGDVMGAAT